MGIKNAGLREYEKTLLDILANGLFGAGRKVDLNEENLNAVWCEAHAQAVTLWHFTTQPKKFSEMKMAGTSAVN